MAKVLLYLSLHDESDLAEESARLDACLQAQSVFDWALLHALENDPLRSPQVTCDLALILALPKGGSFLAQNEHIAELIPHLLQNCVTERSAIGFAFHRCCKGQGLKPIQVHYRMYPRADFLAVDYLDYYVNRHVQFGLDTPLIDYYQTYIDRAASKTCADNFNVPALDAINVSEMHIESMPEFLNSGVFEDIGPQAIADEETFVDRARSSMVSLRLIACSEHYVATLM